MAYGLKASSCHPLIDHSQIVLIVGDLNGLGHLPDFADQISGRQIRVNGPTRSDRRNQYNMRMSIGASTFGSPAAMRWYG